MSDFAISVEHVSKLYRIGAAQERNDTLVMAAASMLRAPLRNFRNLRRLDTIRAAAEGREEKDLLWALRDLTFQIERGEAVGVIGRNGAGKSTLLKILSKITWPSAGRVRLRGRVASLLEVGTGFHRELTGRENVYLNGTILGMTKAEVDSKFDEIIDYSGVARFIDTPVKRYSSGMKVRLAFAVAAHLDPEILIVDEVLAVGDYEFQRKCLGKMSEVASGEGRTVLFVSHNMGMMRTLCTRCIYLKGGQIVADGETDEVIRTYESDMIASADSGVVRFDRDDSLPLQVMEAELLDAQGNQSQQIEQFEPSTLRLVYEVRQPQSGQIVGLTLMHQGARIFQSYDTDETPALLERREPGRYEARIPLPMEHLKGGSYVVSLFTRLVNGARYRSEEGCLSFEVVEAPNVLVKSYSHKRPDYVAMPLRWQTAPLTESNGHSSSPIGDHVNAEHTSGTVDR